MWQQQQLPLRRETRMAKKNGRMMRYALIHVHVYVHVYIHVYIYIYIYICMYTCGQQNSERKLQ